MENERFEELVRRLRGEGDALSDDELAELDAEVIARARAVDRANCTAEDLEALDAAVEVHEAVAEVQASRAAERERLAGEADERLARLGMSDQGGTDPAEGESAEGETPPEGEQPAEETPAEGDTPPAAEGEGDGTQAAATQPPARRAPIAALSRMRHRMPSNDPARQRSRTVQAAGRPALLAGADLPGIPAGHEVELEQWAKATARRVDAILKMPAPAGVTASAEWSERIHLGTLDVRDSWPDERVLDDDQVRNDEKIAGVVGRGSVVTAAAMTASGGICGPVASDYSLSTIASADRPVRDGMVNFGATRGGVRFILPHTFQSVTTDAPASIWTAATDAAPGQSTKAHATLVCQAPQEATVDAVVTYVKMGNFQARYFPEQIAQYMETVDAVTARVAEATLLAAMVTGSTAVNAGNNGSNQTGAATEFLAEIDRAAAAFRQRHRMAAESPLRLYYPEWFEDMMRADLAREMPGNSGGRSERLAVADAEIDNFLSVRNINVSTYLDSPTGYTPLQGWGAQNAGDLLAWPTKTLAFLTHEAAWMYLDGGELNVGMLRDSSLLNTNDVVIFSEIMEKAVFRGHESLAITMDLCPYAGRAALTDTSSLCATGS